MLQVLETKSLKQQNLTTMSKVQITPQNKSAKIEVILLGIDVHTDFSFLALSPLSVWIGVICGF